jgi:hypothetical protein
MFIQLYLRQMEKKYPCLLSKVPDVYFEEKLQRTIARDEFGIWLLYPVFFGQYPIQVAIAISVINFISRIVYDGYCTSTWTTLAILQL